MEPDPESAAEGKADLSSVRPDVLPEALEQHEIGFLLLVHGENPAPIGGDAEAGTEDGRRALELGDLHLS